MDNNKSFKINLVINKEGIQEYQVVNQKQVNSIKKLKEEVERTRKSPEYFNNLMSQVDPKASE